MSLSYDEVRDLAVRCRLSLTDAEVARYANDLGELEALSAALLPYAEETNALGDRTCGLDGLRPDAVRVGLDREALLALGDRVAEGCFEVPAAVKE